MTSSCAEPSPARSSPRTTAAGMPARLAHHELRRAGDLVGDRDLRRVQLVADAVALPAQVEQRAQAGGADRDVGRALPPRAAEGVADDHADLAARSARASRARSRSAEASGSTGRRTSVVRAGRVRGVDARRRADEAVPRLGDDERRPRAHDAGALAQDHLEPARVAVVRRARGRVPTARRRRAGRRGPRPSRRPSARRRGRRRRAARRAAAMSAPRSSPAPISGRPSSGRTSITGGR